MMDDLVSRKSAIEEVKGIDRHFAKYIEELPSAKPCGDVVSRNAIIQKLNKMDRYVSAELRLCDTDKKFPQNEVFIVDDVYEEIAEQLPSVQPERPTGEWIQKPRYEDDEYPDAQPNLKCPFCGYEIGWCDMGNYCARCGADMRGDSHDFV